MPDYHQFCGLARALDLVGDRWNLLIVRELLIDERRHGELKAALPGIATNLLSERLRQLVAAGIVERHEQAGRKAVAYSLTEHGKGLREPVLGLVRWGARTMAAGPRPGDVVQAQWLALAIEALLPASGLPAATVLVRADGAEFTVQTSAAGARVMPGRPGRADATVDAPAAMVLGLFAGALGPDSPGLARARLEDPRGLLGRILAPVHAEAREPVPSGAGGEPSTLGKGMPPDEVARIVAWLEERGAVYQCNGGWAVDALVGTQTRPHSDLDVFLDEGAVADAVAWLEQDGYRVVEDWRPVRVELRDGDRAVDLHPMRIEPNGDGVQALLDGFVTHAAAARTRGTIGGRSVVIASAARLSALREGYEQRDVDEHDLALLRSLLR